MTLDLCRCHDTRSMPVSCDTRSMLVSCDTTFMLVSCDTIPYQLKFTTRHTDVSLPQTFASFIRWSIAILDTLHRAHTKKRTCVSDFAYQTEAFCAFVDILGLEGFSVIVGGALVGAWLRTQHAALSRVLAGIRARRRVTALGLTRHMTTL